jgi:hypothetical protein
VDNLVSYALGRPSQFSDEDLCDAILARADAGGPTLQALIQALVASRPFQTK